MCADILYYGRCNFIVSVPTLAVMTKVSRILLLCVAVCLSACDSAPVELRMVAPSSNLDSEIVNDLAESLNTGPDFRVQVSTEQHTGEVALDMLAAGDADIALVSNYLPFREEIAAIMPVYPSVLHIAYHEGRDPSSGRTLLSQATVFAGTEGSASRLMFERIADRLGLTGDDFAYVEPVDGLAASQPDVAIIFAPISPQRREDLAGYRLYSLGTPADVGTGSVVDAATLLNRPLRPFVIPASTYGASNADPIVTIAVDKMLVVRQDLDPAIVYDLIYAVQRARPALSAKRAGVFEQISADFDASNSTFVLHAGAQNYLRRDEPTVYERYSGVAEVVVTLMIGIISASFAVYRILQVRRKNRIDEFYSAALVIRDRLSESATEAEKRKAVQDIRELQKTAFEQLVDEKLSADDSFRIFITLSNDILRQADKEPDSHEETHLDT